MDYTSGTARGMLRAVLILFLWVGASRAAPVAYFMLNEAAGVTVADDSSGMANDGQLMGNPVWTTGRVDGGLSFSGAGDYVEIPNAASLDITETITLSAWVKPGNTGARAQIINGSRYQLRLNGLTTEFLILDSDANEANQYGNVVLQGSALPENQWSFLAATYDYTTRTMQIYINGAPDGNGLVTSGGDGRINSYNGNRFLSSSVNPFAGIIDEAIIDNAALSAATIQDRFNAATLLGHWTLDDNGTTAADGSSNGNHGTLIGSPAWTTGKIGGALSFGGAGDYVEIPNAASLDITNSFSIAAWVKPGNTGSRAQVFNGGSYQLRLNGLRTEFLIHDIDADQGNQWGNIVLQGTALPENEWSYLVASYDPGTRQMQIYINGEPDGEGLLTTGGNGTVDNIPGKRFISSQSYPFSGVIDDIWLFNSTLTAADVRTQYQDVVLAGLWKLGESSGSNASDSSVYGNHGSLTHTNPVWRSDTGGGLNFAGAGEAITIPASASLDITESVTVSAWLKPTNSGTTAQIFDAGSYQLRLQGLTAEFMLRDTDAAQANPQGDVILQGPVLPEGQWSWLTATYNDTTRKLQFFLNGVPFGTGLITTGGDGKIESLAVDASISDTSEAFQGALYDVAVYNQALTADVIYRSIPQRNDAPGVYPIWYKDQVYDLPFVEGAQIVLQWGNIETSQGVYDFSTLVTKLTEAKNRGVLASVQINGNLKPAYLFNLVPYHPLALSSQVSDLQGTLMYWHPDFVTAHNAFLAAYASFIKESPLAQYILGIRQNFNAIGTEHYVVPSQNIDLAQWQVPPGVDPHVPWTKQIGDDYRTNVLAQYVSLFNNSGVQLFVRNSIDDTLKATYQTDFEQGRLSWFHTSSEAEPRSKWVEPQYETFFSYARSGMTTAYAESWASAWGHHGGKTDDRWNSPPQWNYWRVLFDLHCGVSFIGVYGDDLGVALNGTYSRSGVVYDDSVSGFDYQYEFTRAFQFASRYAGFHNRPNESPGAWVAFRKNSVVLAANGQSVQARTLVTFTDDYNFLATRLADNSVGEGVINRGPDEQRFGAWARQVLAGDSLRIALDTNFVQSLGGQPAVLRVIYLDDASLAGTEFDVIHSGGQTLTVLSGGTGKWKELEISIANANFVADVNGAHISVVNTGSQTLELHMIEVRRGDGGILTDTDGDGLSDVLELAIGTDPNLQDTDGDGVSDFDEVNFDGNAAFYTPGVDLNPLSADTDGDGFTDGYDGRITVLAYPGGQDRNGDGYVDGELQTGTDPLLASSFPGDGDINQDGIVDVGDIVLIHQIVLGLITPTAEEILHSDVAPVSGPDGSVNTADILILTRMALGL